MRKLYLFAALLGLAPLLLMTGGVESPLRLLFYPVMILFIPVAVGASVHYQAAVLFSVLYCLLPLGGGSAYPVTRVAVNVLFFLLAALASGRLSDMLYRERESFRRASDSYHGLTNALNLNIMNLQSRVDSLSEAHERLQEADRNKTRFISGVSHEIRNPLASIRSFSEILLNYDDIGADTRKEFIGIISKESERLTQLANEILDVVRMASGKVEWHMDTVDLPSVVQTAVNTMAPLAKDKGLPIETSVPEGIPPVRGDSNRLLQVFLNLLSNAVKFTSHGKITVGIEDMPNEIRAYVSDTGEGIYPEEKDKIFEEFYRIGDNLTGRPKGSGLGLSIAKNIVGAHGGRIWVDSTLGKGSTFYFLLPKERAEAKTEESAPHGTVSIRHILVLDDYRPVRQILRGALEGLGYKTLGAEGVGMAIEMAKARKPDAILLGHPMNEEHFEELRIFSRLHAIPLLLASVINDEKAGPQIAVNGYISKPFDINQAISAIETALNSRKGKILVVSDSPEEARNFQLLVGTRGYETDIVSEPSSINSSRLPEAAVIGALPKAGVYRAIEYLRNNPRTRDIPLLLILNIMLRDIRCISLESSAYGSGLEKLIEDMEAKANV